MSPPARRPVAYLIRAWAAGSQPDDPAQVRFLAERIGEPPQRQGFESFAALVAFLQAELVGEQDAHNLPPPGTVDDAAIDE